MSFKYKPAKIDNGYLKIYKPDDHEADSAGYVYEHRLVARSKYGGNIPEGSVIHHIDGNKLNNQPSNLTIMPKSEHIKNHHLYYIFKKKKD